MLANVCLHSSLGSSYKLLTCWRAAPRLLQGLQAMVKKTSFQRLTPFLRGAIFAFALAGYSLENIQDQIKKSDGAVPCLQTISDTIARCRAEGGFAGDGNVLPTETMGRSRVTSTAFDKKIKKFVFKYRGNVKVTARFVRKHLPGARKFSTRTLQRRIEAAGLAWLRRRRKSIVPANHKTARMSFARWVLRQADASLKRWAFTDGASFYLARTAAEQADSVRASLGPYVYRMADGSDALFEDCIGPSSYKKSQGHCIRIWGLLLAGTLFVYVLPAGECMNRWWYEWIVLKQFPKWIVKAIGSRRMPTGLVQDHEKALWTAEGRNAIKAIGLKLFTKFPKCSQDLNAIETCWREVRSRLAETEPRERETRAEFIVRIRAAVAWVNRNRRNLFLQLCSDQKDRARELLDRDGSRTSF